MRQPGGQPLEGERVRARRWTCLAAALLTMAAGLVWRLMPLGMPAGLVKYGGSALWAIMVYWLAAAALPGWRTLRVGLLAFAIAAAVECFKLVRTPGLDHFRATLAGKLLLGKYFSIWDLLVYALAIAIVAWADERWLVARPSQPSRTR